LAFIKRILFCNIHYTPLTVAADDKTKEIGDHIEVAY